MRTTETTDKGVRYCLKSQKTSTPPREVTTDTPCRNTGPHSPFHLGFPNSLHIAVSWGASRTNDARFPHPPPDCDSEDPRASNAQASLESLP